MNTDTSDAIIARFAELLPRGAVLRGGGLDPVGGVLYAEERQAIANAVPLRVREFRAGRVYARRALRALGLPDGPILPRKLRSPIWPSGTTGSISHCRHVCAAVVGLTKDIASVGIDIEDFTAATFDLEAMVATPSEMAQQQQIQDLCSIPLGYLLFSMKEATYKAYCAIAGDFLNYHDVEVSIDAKSNCFRSKLIAADKPFVLGRDSLEGRFCVAFGHVLALAEVPR